MHRRPNEKDAVVDTGEQLAAYLADELDADEVRALEARLAGDAALRARLEAMREIDDVLARMGDPEPPRGYSDRLHASIQEELDRRQQGEATVISLASRRRWRARAPQLAGAAAVLVTVVAVGVGLSARGGDDSATMAGDESEDMAVMAPEAADSLAAPGPLLLSQDRSYDEDAVRDVADDPAFDRVVEQLRSSGGAEQLADQYLAALTGVGETSALSRESGPAEESEAEDGAGGPEASQTWPSAGGGSDDPSGIARTLEIRGEVDEDDLQAVRACLPPLLEQQDGTGHLVPVYAEIATFEGEPSVVYGLVGRDPASDTYSRVEIWVVDRGDCQVRFLTQQDR